MSKAGKIIEPNEYKTLIKDMLADFHKICVDNNIRYFVAYGTLIGTIRHNGFIPWDDDIDVWMHGEDYDRFVDIVSNSNSKYYILSLENSPYYFNVMARFCSNEGILKLKGVPDIDNFGPFIDIFPFYKAPENREERMKFYNEIYAASLDVKYSLPFRYYKTLSFRSRMSAYLECIKRWKKRYLIGTEKLKKAYKELITKYEETDSLRYYPVFHRLNVPDRRLFSQSEIEEVELHKFEDIEVFVPKSYHSIMTRLYGDYMKLPPVEEQVPKHHFIPYWK